MIIFKYFLNGSRERFKGSCSEVRNSACQVIKPSSHSAPWYSCSYPEIKDTLTLLDKAVNNKETRTISRITKNVKKYRNIIRGHHLAALYECLGFDLPSSIKNSPDYRSDFT